MLGGAGVADNAVVLATQQNEVSRLIIGGVVVDMMRLNFPIGGARPLFQPEPALPEEHHNLVQVDSLPVIGAEEAEEADGFEYPKELTVNLISFCVGDALVP